MIRLLNIPQDGSAADDVFGHQKCSGCGSPAIVDIQAEYSKEYGTKPGEERSRSTVRRYLSLCKECLNELWHLLFHDPHPAKPRD